MRRLILLLLVVPAVASASGFYLTENGAKTLMMGGAFAGQADDLSAIQHNPAGLAQLQGFNFLLDAQLVTHDISFQRYDPGFDPANPPMGGAQSNPVSNIGGPFLAPMIGVGYGLKLLDRNLFVGIGLYGPPADGHYAFPAPNYAKDPATGKYVDSPRKSAPQRYSLVDNTIFIVFPTLSIAYAVHPKVMLGVSLQPVVGSFNFSQSVTSITRLGIQPMRQADEDPVFDSMVHVDLPWQYLNFTAVFGALVKPVENVSIGVSFRPQVMMNARGKLKIDLGEAATGLMTQVTGDETTLSLMLPAEVKAGLHMQLTSRFALNFDFVYQGWQSVQEIVVDPQNVYFQMGTTAPAKVATFRIQKHWQESYNFRLGGSFALFDWLSLYLGGWYESGAIPDKYIGVDFLHFERPVFTGGVGVKFKGFEFLLGAAGSPAMTHAVTKSEVRAGSTEPDPGGVVATGVYTSSNFQATLGIRGSFGGGPKRPATTEEPGPAPPPAEEAPKP